VHVIATHSGPACTVLGLVSTVVLAWLSFHFFESRFLNLKERLTIRGAAA